MDALAVFTVGCPDWRAYVHESDCPDRGGEHMHPKDELPDCTCDGVYNTHLIEDAMEQAVKAGIE